MPRTPVRTFLPLALALAGLIAGAASAAPAAQPSFKDDFGTLDTARWMRADGWGTGSHSSSSAGVIRGRTAPMRVSSMRVVSRVDKGVAG